MFPPGKHRQWKNWKCHYSDVTNVNLVILFLSGFVDTSKVAFDICSTKRLLDLLLIERFKRESYPSNLN